MGTQVITRDTGRRLGVVGEVVVDIDRREVVALGLRDNPLTRFLPGLPRWMPLASIRQVGDVILVDSADSLTESFDPERYSKVINCQVITESGVQLGRVLGFSFDIETGELTSLVIGALGVPLLGEGVLSTWELAVGEIVSSGTDRIIVYEGAEDKLKQLGTGLLEKLGIGGGGWEQEERERFRGGMVPAENQLPAGQPSASEQRRIQPATSRAVLSEDELDYVELEERREREPLRQRRYLDEDEREERRGAGGGREQERRYGEGRRDADPYGPARDRTGERRNEERRDQEDRFPPPRRQEERREPLERRDLESRRDRDAFESPRLQRRTIEPEALDQGAFEPEDTRRRPFPGPPEDDNRYRPAPTREEAAGPGGRPRFEAASRRGEPPERDPWREPGQPPPESSLPQRPPREPEPIDVEPEVLDDPW